MPKTLYLIDGTLELFRMYFGSSKHTNSVGREVGACRMFIYSLANLILKYKMTHVSVAFSSIIESFRNFLLPTYKTSARVPPDLFSQFKLAEEITKALGVNSQGMILYEGDDAISTLVNKFKNHPEIEKIIILSVDKDFAQCVEGSKIVFYDRFRNQLYDEPAIVQKWGILPKSIPDYLGLVGDSSDGIPGIPNWGKTSAAKILSKYNHIENIPHDNQLWTADLRNKNVLSDSLMKFKREVLLYRFLATLRKDVPINISLNDLEWKGIDLDQLDNLTPILELPKIGSKQWTVDVKSF